MKNISQEQVYEWLGGDSAKTYEMIEIIAWIANGEYSAEQLKSDIIIYGWEEEQ